MDAIGGVVGFGCMLYDAGVPYMSNAHIAKRIQYTSIDLVHFTGTILGYGAIKYGIGLRVGKQPRE